MTTTSTAALTAELTPTQVRGLKLAKDGDLHPQDGNKWTHLNAAEIAAELERTKGRVTKVKFATSTTLNQLRELGLLRSLDTDTDAAKSIHGITMAGKMWLLKHK